MGIEIESPEDFLSDYKDPKHFSEILLSIRSQPKGKACIIKKTNHSCISESIYKAQEWLERRSKNNAFWNADITANPGLGAQFILMAQGMNYPNRERMELMWQYIEQNTNAQGLFSLYHGGPEHYSTNLIIYLAGISLGKDTQLIYHLKNYLKAHDIVKNINMETRLLLATYGLIAWDCVPMISPLLILLPESGEFNIYSISYWVRTSLVPMAILYGMKYHLPYFPLTKQVLQDLYPHIKEFPAYVSPNRMWEIFLRAIRKTYTLSDQSLLQLSLGMCEKWILDHQEKSGDWGGIYPAMQYSLMALYARNKGFEDTNFLRGWQAVENFQKTVQGSLHQQSCVSPVWDTAWSLIALHHSGVNLESYTPYFDWLIEKQILQEGDWSIRNKTGFGGGWAFQFDNTFYPDTDDSAVVIMALLRQPNLSEKSRASIELGVRWLLSMQNPDGGWSAFEQGVDDEYVDMIPFNDMENWRDPSTADVTGRCLQMLGELNIDQIDQENLAVKNAIEFLLRSQEKDGSWFGRWGVNYIYGTWSVLMGLSHFLPANHPAISKAVEWIQSIQNPDGGWGESCQSYIDGHYIPLHSTASQTAWALLALQSTLKQNSVSHKAVEKGMRWLLDHQTSEGDWREESFTGTGFPKHFYLRYDFYRHYFPLWALGNHIHFS